MKKPYSKKIDQFQKGAGDVERFFKAVEHFAPLLEEADVLDLATTCSMGSRSKSHSQTDEGRDVGRDFVIPFRKDILDRVEAMWSKSYQLAKSQGKLQLDLVLPTGTSLGWPFLFPDDEDGSRTLVLAAVALATDVSKKQGLKLRDVLDLLRGEYGSRFVAPGWRYQHTNKPMPVFYDGGFFYTSNVEFRVRLIAMLDKVSVVWNREVSKKAVSTALLMPQHNQDRNYIKRTFEEWRKHPNRKQIAVDVSGFDNSFGGGSLKVLLGVLARSMGSPDAVDDLVEEVRAPMLVPYGKGVFQTHSQLTPQLPSGASCTTAIGLLASDYIVHCIGYHMNLEVYPGGAAPRGLRYLSWGDDIVIDAPIETDFSSAFSKVTKEMQIEFDEEPTLKYLGFNYASGTVKAQEGYSIGRLLQKSIFPESPTVYPFSIIGYAARLSFVKSDPALFHSLFTQHLWDPVRFGPAFRYQDLNQVLLKALEDAKDSKKENRDVLNFLLHGLNPIEGKDLIEPFMDFDFTKWVGRSYIDFSDPLKAAAEVGSDLARFSVPWLKGIEKGGYPSLIHFVNTLGRMKGWRREGVYM